MRTIKFCSAVFGVTLRLPVINKQDSLMRGASSSVYRDKRTPSLSAIMYTPPKKCWRHSTVQQSSMPKPDIDRKSRFLPQLRGYTSEYCYKICCGKKLEWCDYPIVRKRLKIWLVVLTQYMTDTARRQRSRLCIASSGKKWERQRWVGLW